MLVSIIICSYNSADSLDGALYSALSQDFSSDEYEVLLVDDGSTDATVELAGAYGKRHGNFRYVRLPLNKGMSTACDYGLLTARGKYFTGLDADDALHPRMLAECVAPLEQGLTDLVYCDYHDVDLADGSHRHIRLDCFDPIGMVGSAAMLRMDAFRALYRRGGFSVNGGNEPDIYQTYIQASGRPPYHVPRPLYYRCPRGRESVSSENFVAPKLSMHDTFSDRVPVTQTTSPVEGRTRMA